MEEESEPDHQFDDSKLFCYTEAAPLPESVSQELREKISKKLEIKEPFYRMENLWKKNL